ncbi:hypothetical protein C8A01DRAFT_40662 [Parachaetomium inaequale]|uniref:Ankyrin n=1 Tax=Parachaetomium inaequale TaxID=2588326 RepID=A0AAN6P6Y6_9PEZI|nr:hypothetical protein C8A01DRAFT_40662 [Parachaetomium inaequale]
MATASLSSLPAELICEITEHLLGDRAFGSAAALAQCSRRLCGPVLALLYDNVGRVNQDAGEDGLIWAAENDEVGTLKAFLESGVNPNVRFWSTLPDCARQDVFAAQRLRRRLAPRPDGHLVARLLQENVVQHQRRRWRYWPQSYNARFKEWYLATINGDIPESPADLVHDVTNIVRAARFSCHRSTIDFGPGSASYTWTALHVATQRNNMQAVEILLAHGAKIELRCRGLCDCLTPACSDFSAGEPPPTCTSLHIAVCSGHPHLARLFLARGANHTKAGQTTSDAYGFAPLGDIPAFHTAALRGDVAMCQLLLDHHAASGSGEPGGLLEQKDHRELRALDYAVAAGHTRTTGSWLLEQGADPLQHLTFDSRLFLAPLNFLCHRGQYRDAHYLLDMIRSKTPSTLSPPNYTLALQACFVRLRTPRPPFTVMLGSLRRYLDEYMQLVVSEKPPYPERDSEEALVGLVKQLLDVGADPSAALVPCERDMELDFSVARAKSALDLAANCGEREALKVMLDAVAEIDSHVSDTMRRTTLISAILPPRYSPAYENPQVYLETIIFLLERGASFKKALNQREPDKGLRDLFSPLFEPRINRTAWYNLDRFDLFERVMELVAKELGEEQFPAAWAADLLYVSVKCGNQNGNFCRWLVKRYELAPTDFSASDLELFSPLNPDKTLSEPGMVEWLLDFMPDTATKLHEPQTQQPEDTALVYAGRGFLPAARVFVERGLVDMASGAEADEKTSAELEERFRDIIFEACARVIRKGSANLIHAN